MRKTRTEVLEKRRQLLMAAGEFFAARGFRSATIAEICRKANANIAAANYHFGSKEALYVESWRFSFQQSLKSYPPDGGVPADAPPEERLRGRIVAIMQRILDPRSHELDIVNKEMANPTGLLDEIIPAALEPIFQGMSAVIREVLGPAAGERQVQLCLMSILSQCFGPLMHQRRRTHTAAGRRRLQEEIIKDVQALADHVTRFSLAGMLAVGGLTEGKNVREKRPAHWMAEVK